MRVNIKVSGIDELLAQFKEFPQLQERAMVNALNVLGRSAVKEAKRGIQEVYNIKSGDISEAVNLTLARGGASGRQRLFAIITARGGRLPLFKFGALPTTPRSQKGIPVAGRRPVTVMVKKKDGRHPVYADKKTQHVPFLARMQSGHIGVFVRMDQFNYRRSIGGKKMQRYQMIRELLVKGVPAMFEKRGGEAMRRLVQETGLDVIRQKLNDQMAKWQKR